MKKHENATYIETTAAFLTWAVISGAMIFQIATSSSGYAGTLELAVLGAVAYGVTMFLSMDKRLTKRVRRWANLGQLASVIFLAWLLPIDYLQIYTIIWIAMSVSFYQSRTSYLWLVGIVAGWYLIWEFHWFRDSALLSTALYATFHIFALMSSMAALRAEKARDETQVLYRELVATQHLLSEASRQNERTRIARNLHDLVGHHLTALSINLQIAEHTTEGDAKMHVAQSRALAKLLLSDVREAVSTLRDKGELDFRRALDLIVENVPQLHIDLEIDEALQIDNVEIADALLRCIQEAITNTLRHANATHSWVSLWQADGNVKFSIRDDGQAPALVEAGNGLSGMRERIHQLGGSLRFGSGEGGFGLSGSVPLVNA
ncbi:MAG: sensor histidine kinase [Woeseiaceae bacterium]